MTNYENKDYVIPIHTSDHKTLYFSKNILITRCEMVRMLEKNDQLDELNVPFESQVLIDFLFYIEFEEFTNIKNFCIVADYFRYDHPNSMMRKNNLIDLLLDKMSCEPSLTQFYKYIKSKNLIPKELNQQSIDQLFLNLKPIENRLVDKEKLDWLDLVETYEIPEVLSSQYNELFKQYHEIRAIKQDNYEELSNVLMNLDGAGTRNPQYAILLKQNDDYIDVYNDFVKKYKYNSIPYAKGPGSYIG